MGKAGPTIAGCFGECVGDDCTWETEMCVSLRSRRGCQNTGICKKIKSWHTDFVSLISDYPISQLSDFIEVFLCHD